MKWLLLTFAFCLPVAASAAEVSCAEVFKASFAAWDSNQDGTLTKLEIDSALADPQIKGDAAAALAVVKRLNRSKTWSAIPLSLEGVSAVP
ncbi:MAG: hypothetical protein NTV80_19495, partial [Verrucomicrobia bacterium]|nr:hypothetical protein [Verrucomicrobiota bacterium]